MEKELNEGKKKDRFSQLHAGKNRERETRGWREGKEIVGNGRGAILGPVGKENQSIINSRHVR
jgi:hypothetical protein